MSVAKPATEGPAPATITGLIADSLAALRATPPAPDVRRFAVHMLLDCLGCTVAGGQTPNGRAALGFARYGKEPQARTIDGTHVSVERAAFANTVCCNALDHEPIGPEGHVGAVAIPTALALAEWLDATGDDLLRAIVAGLDVSGRIGAAWRRPSSVIAQGTPAVRGAPHAVFASAVPAAYLLGLDRETVRHAIGIAGYSAHVPTLRKAMSELEPPMTKYDHLGGMAQGGIDAVRLAQLGFTGDLGVFEGPIGMWRFSGALGCDWTLLETFGGDFMIGPTFFKTYPCIIYENSVLIALAAIVTRERLAPDAIERIVLRPSRAVDAQRGDGRGGPMAQWMSLRHNAAHAICGTRPFPVWHDGTQAPAIARLVDATTFEPYAPAEGEPKGNYWDGYSPCSVTIFTRDGRRFDERIISLRRMTEEPLLEKFVENVAPVAGEARARKVAAMVLEVDRLPRAATLLDELFA
jgi:2-methylcitrate dehydratase PrpD